MYSVSQSITIQCTPPPLRKFLFILPEKSPDRALRLPQAGAK
jgi:hypothetical protein